MEDDSFVLLTVAEMRQKFYQPNELPPRLSLRSENVPKSLQKLIPIAERWGISDDLLRQDARRTATPAELKYLMAVIDHFDDALDDWLRDQKRPCRFNRLSIWPSATCESPQTAVDRIKWNIGCHPLFSAPPSLVVGSHSTRRTVWMGADWR